MYRKYSERQTFRLISPFPTVIIINMLRRLTDDSPYMIKVVETTKHQVQSVRKEK